MKITDLQVDGFGVWTKLSIENLNDRMTVFYGRNEAGKTTLMQFVRTVLYGFSAERRTRYLPPLRGGKPGGALGVSHGEGSFSVRRKTKVTDPVESLGESLVTAADGAVQGGHFLSSMLGGIDESIFNNVFAVGLREIQELGTLDSTEAADQLYKLTSGLDRVSLVDVMRELERSRNHIISNSDERSQVIDLLRRHDELRREIDEHTSRGQRWSRIASQRVVLESEVAELDKKIEALEQQVRLVEIAQRVHDKWELRDSIRQQIAALPRLPAMPERGIERLESYNLRLSTRREKIELLKRHAQTVRDETEALPINRRLWENASRIDALAEHSHWISSLQHQIETLEGEATMLDLELKSYAGELGLSEASTAREVAAMGVPEISSRTMGILRSPARAMREESGRHTNAKADMDRCRREAEELALEIESLLAERGKADLAGSLEETGGRVTRLRRRIQLEERLERLNRDREQLQEESQELLEEQVLPFQQVALIGVVFIFGVVLFMSGTIWSVTFASGMGLPIALLGLAALGLMIGYKWLLERSSARELDDCTRQLELVSKQVRTLKEERDMIDNLLPTGGGTLDVRLSEAEHELARLEELLPLENDRQTAWQRFEIAKERVDQTEEAVKDSREKWRAALRRVNLSPTLSPKHVKQLSERYDQVSQLQHRRDSRREELTQRERELSTVLERLQVLMEDCGLKSANSTPQEQLKVLLQAQADQQEHLNKRSALRRKLRTLLKDLSRGQRSYESVERRRYALLAEVGVDNETAFRRVSGQHDQLRALQTELEELTSEIRERLGAQVSEDDVAPEFKGRGAFHLDRRHEQLQTELKQAEQQVASLHEKRGEYSQEMKSLAEDRRLAEAKLDLSCVERRLEQAIARWQVLAAATLVLESIREIYETERQPETLSAATRYLRKLTGGQYKRVWTPLGKDVLQVDDALGQSLPLDVLSQGTREAVFLAIRLALVDAYAQRGATLPMVLDDVMVNLDGDRMMLAAKVLSEFATDGRQVLLFTCHEHIVNAFNRIHVETRRLPNRLTGEAISVSSEPAAYFEAIEEEEEIEQEEEIVQVYGPIEEEEPAEELLEDANDALDAAADEAEEEAWEEPVAVEEPEPEVEETFFVEPPAPDYDYTLAPAAKASKKVRFTAEELLAQYLDEPEPEPEPEPVVAKKPVIVETIADPIIEEYAEEYAAEEPEEEVEEEPYEEPEPYVETIIETIAEPVTHPPEVDEMWWDDGDAA
ncbi:ATP-binding protein [Lignipirellula cremea]|uniref:YhaN AAA domain-containing protein n=1 Tax=Lignipirellula cremea TaxID=2528010 RepID=A0A518DSQ9_9BACT|nr:AAA family ATPase [Lignipirellula cremea]QDU94877.1 hypothetical protein Pla8534_26850 [Lignipirellula cremea]